MWSREARPVGVLRVCALLIIACAWLVAASAGEMKGTDRASDKGKTVYLRYCVSCHGQGARGDGPLAKDLRVSVPDLTTLAARNAGQDPAQRIQKIIESGEGASPAEAIRNLTEYIRALQRQEGKSSP
jgi:mono/diheme cytochrome c family protein